MNWTNRIAVTILTVFLLTSCDFIKNAITYKEKTQGLVETLLKEDYDKVFDHFAMDHEMAKGTDKEAMKSGLATFRESIVKDFGTILDYKFMSAEKKWSTGQNKSTPPNTTVALIQYSNNKDFGVFKVLFDDTSGKILTINTLDVKQPIPSMTLFWLVGLIAIAIPAFNIYAIRLVKRSNQKKKWLKYLAILIFNVPAITYAATGGFSFKLLNFQIMLGISFSYMGYLSSAWTVGLPLGGLYWVSKLRRDKNRLTEPKIAINHLDKAEQLPNGDNTTKE